MSMMYMGLWIGTLVFIFAGFFSCLVCFCIVGQKSANRLEKFENRSIAFTSVTLGVICMWLMWICTYMHQMNPLITPTLENS